MPPCGISHVAVPHTALLLAVQLELQVVEMVLYLSQDSLPQLVSSLGYPTATAIS